MMAPAQAKVIWAMCPKPVWLLPSSKMALPTETSVVTNSSSGWLFPWSSMATRSFSVRAKLPMDMMCSSSVPSSPLGWKCGQNGLDPSIIQPRELKPSEAKGQGRRRYSLVLDLGLLLYLPIAGFLQVGKSALSGPCFSSV